ncbi:MAG: glycosyltransferase family 2 protein [Nanohaloarchaea archaeon]|nr:glycosyltransferase family 2 protein [Candidatus Nanohaloarchaea archaeon]
MSSSLIVPAYNEEEIIENTLDHLNDLEPYFEEIYLMDDASIDSTQQRIEEYLKENDTDVKVAYMMENGDKVGAIREAVRHTDSENVVLTDSDTELSNPEKLEDAETYLDENKLEGLAFKIVPDCSSENLKDRIWTRLQDFEYAMTRSFADYTTGESFRLDPDHKKVKVVPGAGGMYKTEELQEALDNHSGKHAGDDIETTSYVQLIQDGAIDHFDDIVMKTKAPISYEELNAQRKRWMKGGFQAFQEQPLEHLKETLSGSRYGQVMATETAAAATAPLLLGKAGFEASQGDFAGMADSLEHLAYVQVGMTAVLGSHAISKDDFVDKKTIPAGAAMPLYKPAVVIPSLVQAEKEVVTEEVSEAKEGFFQGIEEGNSEYSRIRELGRAFERSRQKAREIFSFGEEDETEALLEEDSHSEAVAAD